MEILHSHERSPRMNRFEQAVDDLESLEVVPAVAQRVIGMTSDPDCRLGDIERLVSSDAALSARVLRLAATPAYLARPPRTLRAALAAIGTADLRKIVLTASLPGAGSASGFGGALWRHALQTAHLAQSLAPKLRLSGGPDPFLCGLLHEVGTMALLRLLGTEYARLLGRPGTDEQCAPERALLGFDHADFGAVVAARWRLFPELEVVVQLHHDLSLIDRLALPRATAGVVRLVALSRAAIVHPDDPRVEQLAASFDLAPETLKEEVTASAALTASIAGALG
jgi:HD-like signal output (HDOD) protein